MLLNKLTVFASLETKAYFNTILAGSPIEINVEDFKVDIITTSGELETKPSAVYTALSGSMNIWYDAARQESSLILPLFSNSLTNRFYEISNSGSVPYWYPSYNPYMTFKFNMPTRHKHYRGFLNSIATTLATSKDYLTFDSEYAELVEELHPLNYDYNVDCQSRF